MAAASLMFPRSHNDETTNVFSNKTTLERDRLLLLRKVNISYRYYTDIVINEEDIEYFFDELGKLQQMADQIFYSNTSLQRAS